MQNGTARQLQKLTGGSIIYLISLLLAIVWGLEWIL